MKVREFARKAGTDPAVQCTVGPGCWSGLPKTPTTGLSTLRLLKAMAHLLEDFKHQHFVDLSIQMETCIPKTLWQKCNMGTEKPDALVEATLVRLEPPAPHTAGPV